MFRVLLLLVRKNTVRSTYNLWMERIHLLGRSACIRRLQGHRTGPTYRLWKICRGMGKIAPRVQGSNSLARSHQGKKDIIAKRQTFNLSLNVWETPSSLSMNLPKGSIPPKMQQGLLWVTKAPLSPTYRIIRLQTDRWRKVRKYSRMSSRRWTPARRREIILRTRTLFLMIAVILLGRTIKIIRSLCRSLLSKHWNR